MKLRMEALKKFHSTSSPRARSYIWGTMRRVEGYHVKPTMHKLILKGNKPYIARMFKHLKKEHPSVRGNIFMR